MTRFGPRRMIWAVALVGLALVVASFLIGWHHPWPAAIGGLLLVLTLPGWNWYRLDAEGIHRVGIAGRRDVPWDAVGGVVNRSAVPDRFGEEVVTQFVVDLVGRRLLRLDAWVGNRGRFVRIVLATVRVRAEEGGLRAEASSGSPVR